MDNLDFLGIYKNQIDKVVELCEGLVEQAGIDIDDYNDEVLNNLMSDNPSFKDLTPAIISKYMDEAEYEIEEKFEKLGLNELFEIKSFCDGYYSSFTINDYNQNILQAISDIFEKEFSFIPDIKDIISYTEESNPLDIDDFIDTFADELITYMQNEYDSEIYNSGFFENAIHYYNSLDSNEEISKTILEFRDVLIEEVRAKDQSLNKDNAD